MSDNIEDVKDVMKGNNVNMHVCEKYTDVCDVCFNLQTGVKTLTDSCLYVVTVAVIVVDEVENDDDESSSSLLSSQKNLPLKKRRYTEEEKENSKLF